MNDEELVKRTLDGDSESFGKLIHKYQGFVQGLVYHSAGSFDDAEDISQETFISAYLKLRQLQNPERFVSWLRQIAINCCKMWARKHKESVSLDDVGESSIGFAPTPAEELEQKERRRLVHQALSQIPEENSLVVSLYYLNGESYKDIARFLNVPLKTVEGRMQRAKKQLKRRLMRMVEDTLRNERLPDEFNRKVLKEAMERAKEAQKHWVKEDFVQSCHKALDAAVKLDDSKVQIELLSMLGDAGSTWLGESDKAIENYLSALEIADKHEDKTESAKILKGMFVAHCRHGEYGKMRQRAQEALKLFSELGDREGEALAQSALDLADALPNAWKPGQPGGYAMAVFPVEKSKEGITFLDPKSVRNYTWGCPSRCTALAYLLRPRRLLGTSLDVGAAWEDQISQIHDGLSWGIRDGDELIAKSEIESNDDVVVTPAGRFGKCLRVKTSITSGDGSISAEFTTRSYSGAKIMWFAPGTGLVKLYHEDQNGTVWRVQLTEHIGPADTDCFPLSAGQTWQYRWTGHDGMFFEDVCRVISDSENVFYISSATQGVSRSNDEILSYLAESLKLERESHDLMGEAAVLEELANQGKDQNACYERLIEIYESLGDELKLVDARWHLKGLNSPQDHIGWQTEKLGIARKLGNWMKEARALIYLSCGHQDAGNPDQAIELCEQAAKVFAEHGDAGNAASQISDVEVKKAERCQPATPQCSYVCGVGYILLKDDKLHCGGSSRGGITGAKFPPGEYKGSPMTDLFYNGPFEGIELLSGSVGESVMDYSNCGAPWGTEGMRIKSTLISKDEVVTVPAGKFSKCALIESHISTSDESSGEETERKFYQSYWAGVKKSWFAPGVGVVRMVYQHRNGYETEIQLVKYEITAPAEDYLPLALDNRWRYRWIDHESKVAFEDSLRVASRKKGEWYIAFVANARIV